MRAKVRVLRERGFELEGGGGTRWWWRRHLAGRGIRVLREKDEWNE